MIVPGLLTASTSRADHFGMSVECVCVCLFFCIVVAPSFFEMNRSQNSLLKNILKNSFVGCCMAFHKKVLKKVLPFPPGILSHDQWIGLIAQRYFSVKFIPQTLVDHRRHNSNYSTTGEQSKNSWDKKVISRLQLAKALWQH